MKSLFQKSLLLVLLCVSTSRVWCDSLQAIISDTTQDAQAAFKRIEALASDGSGEAAAQLADLYRSGTGVAKNMQRALEYYKKAAELKIVRAELALAEAYYSGKDVVRDYKEALKWYKLAAKAGSAEAQLKVGEMYRDGLGVAKKNANKALTWFQKAADQGNDLAQKALSEIKKAVNSVSS